MRSHPLFYTIEVASAIAICAMSTLAPGQVYKCTDGGGKTIYADAPCDSAGKPLKLPSDTKATAAGPHVCAQLLDETRRLAAEGERDATRGRAENPDSAKRRVALTRRYEERCVGISRSEATPK